MIKHIVCFKLKDNSKESCEKAAEIFRSMEGKVPQLRSIQVGIDFLHSPRSYDIILETTFDSKEELENYQKDPYHCDVVKKYIHSIQETSIAIDYEI